MSGNPTPSFSASDSGFLNGFDALLREHAGAVRRLDQANPPQKQAAPPTESMAAPSDAEIEQRLRATPLPAGLVGRLSRRLED